MIAQFEQLLRRMDAEDFRAKVFSEYAQKPILETGFDRINMLSKWSYFPNLVSLISCVFFIIYLTNPFPTWSRVMLIILLAGVAIANEMAKRSLIITESKSYLQIKRVKLFPAAALLFCFAVSMYSSFQGGKQLVLENSQPPTLLEDEILKETKEDLALAQSSIAKQEGTTWKGVITVDANRNLKKLYAKELALTAKRDSLQLVHGLKQKQSDEAHQSKFTNFGYVLGSIGLGMDIVLFFILFSIVKTKYDVYRLESRTTVSQQSTTAAHNSSSQHFTTPVHNSFTTPTHNSVNPVDNSVVRDSQHFHNSSPQQPDNRTPQQFFYNRNSATGNVEPTTPTTPNTTVEHRGNSYEVKVINGEPTIPYVLQDGTIKNMTLSDVKSNLATYAGRIADRQKKGKPATKAQTEKYQLFVEMQKTLLNIKSNS